MRIDVFISAKSSDYRYADQLRAFLATRGIEVFFSQESMPQMAEAHFIEAIYDALEATRHMVVVLSRADYARSPWVNAEWNAFLAEKNAGRKQGGNLITLAVGSLLAADLPLGLRTNEVIAFNPSNFKNVLSYLTRRAPPEPAEAPPATARAAPVEFETPPAPDLLENSLGNVLVQVPGEYLPEGQPVGEPFYVSATCVSNSDYVAYVQAGGEPPAVHALMPQLRTWRGDRCPRSMLGHPVVFIAHKDAVRFCQWLTEKERAESIIGRQQQYTLPSLRQWRAFAASARLTDQAILGRFWDPARYQPTEPVDTGAPSRIGLYHVFGNVFEWCRDEEQRKFMAPDGRVLYAPCHFPIGGGWASDFQWLRRRIRKGDCGTVWGPEPWPMQDGGFRICLVSSRRPGRGSKWWSLLGFGDSLSSETGPAKTKGDARDT